MEIDMLSHTRENFTLYPTNRVVAFVDSKLDADEVCCELKDEGFDSNLIDASVGKEGLEFIDPDGVSHGFIAKVIRSWQKLGFGEESAYLQKVKDHLMSGHAVISIPASSDEEKEKARKVLKQHHADSIRFYGRFHVEHMDAA
jgi:hypothetical protein